MDYYTMFILGITSYFVTDFIDRKTKNVIINYITSYNYTIKNGNRRALNEYIHQYPICKILYYLPFVNIITSGIEGIININNINELFEKLKKDEFLSRLSIDEINAYDETVNKEKIAYTIFEKREEFADNENFIKRLSKNENDILTLDKIKMSSIEDVNKICLLKILKYNITNNINDIDYNKLIEYANFFLDFNYSGYYKLFRLNIPKNSYNKETYNKIISQSNKIINTDLNIEFKEQILDDFYISIINEVRTNVRGKNNSLNIDIDLINNDYSIKVKSKKKNII